MRYLILIISLMCINIAGAEAKPQAAPQPQMRCYYTYNTGSGYPVLVCEN